MMLDDYELTNGVWQRKPWLQKPRFFWPDCPCGGGIPGCDFSDTFNTFDSAWQFFYQTGRRADQLYVFTGTTSGTFTLTYDGQTTSAITYSAVPTTLNSNIATALDALSNLSGVTSTSSLVRFSDSGTSDVRKLWQITYDLSGLTGASPALTIETSPHYYVASNYLYQEAYTGGVPQSSYSIFQSFTRPALSGLNLKVSGNIYFPSAGTDVIGVAIGGSNGRAVVISTSASPPTKSWKLYAANSNLELTGGIIHESSPGAFTSGQYLTLEIIDTSSGAGTYTVQVYIDGVNVYSESGASLTIPDPVKIGFYGFGGGVAASPNQWANYCVNLS